MRRLSDLYHSFLICRWRTLFVMLLIGYLLLNALFAELYHCKAGSVSGASTFADHFFFSAQTLSTVGYGQMSPVGAYANTLATLEAFLGLFTFAMASALLFAKFSRPSARVLFSQRAIVTTRNGERCLIFRLANRRSSKILEAQLSVTLIRTVRTKEGELFRKLLDLELERDHTPVFAMTWTVIHPIRPESPFWEQSHQALCDSDAMLLVAFTGLEDSFVQTVHARHSYYCKDLKWGHRFVDILKKGADGNFHVDYDHFHESVPELESR